ncbi:MAG: hypothetical protein DVB23_002834 [Verrucomicrobia bacterium]|jgi:hypothetical protein|nr:MAG: hypothetical protein DVB23_002834 [Verrucomicrobiota bacterium]
MEKWMTVYPANYDRAGGSLPTKKLRRARFFGQASLPPPPTPLKAQNHDNPTNRSVSSHLKTDRPCVPHENRTMTKPQDLTTFKEQLLASPTVQDILAEHCPEGKDAAIARFRSGDDGQFWDLIQNEMDLGSGDFETSLMAAAPDDDVFEIEIFSLGPVFWIRANEFDDIGFFGNRQDALAYAEDFFESAIQELADREEEE